MAAAAPATPVLARLSLWADPSRHHDLADLCEGGHAASWNGRDARGYPVASGVYVVRLQAGIARRTAKVLLVR